MKFTGTTYRPPLEANTPLLQVTGGCAYNKCTFCTMYRDDKFHVENIDQIEKDIRELKLIYGTSLTRIFLVNGDAFTLSARRLKQISDLLISYFPRLKTITMYASISNVKSKSDEELQMLKEARINDLWMGVETGLEETLVAFNKGHNLEDAYVQLERLNQIGIRHLHGLMIGTGGRGRALDSARATAELLNKTKPGLIWICSLGVFEGSKLSEQVDRGEFIQATEREVLEEEIELLKQLNLENVAFYSNHPTNTVKFYGMLPQDKTRMIDYIHQAMDEMETYELNAPAPRYSL